MYAMHLALWQGFDIRVVGVLIPPKDSMLLHWQNAQWASKHAEALGIPRISMAGDDLSKLFLEAREKFGVEWVIIGALASEFQRFKFNEAAEVADLKVHAPLWHLNGKRYLKMLTSDGFSFLIVGLGAEGMDDWLGREISEENVDAFLELVEKLGIHPAGEGGEYETFLVKSPLYSLCYRGRKSGRTFLLEEVRVCSRRGSASSGMERR